MTAAILKPKKRPHDTERVSQAYRPLQPRYRQTDGRTDARPFHRLCPALSIMNCKCVGSLFSYQQALQICSTNKAIEDNRLRLRASPRWVTYSSRLCLAMTSSAKQQVLYLRHCRQMKIEPQPQLTCTETFPSVVTLGWTCGFWDMRTGRQTQGPRDADCNTSHTSGLSLGLETTVRQMFSYIYLHWL